MKKSIQNTSVFILMVLSLFLLFKIQILIIYLFISLVLSITITPINNIICSIKLKKIKINRNIGSIICLLIIASFTSLIVYLISPLIVKEIDIVKSIQGDDVQSFLHAAADKINQKIGTSFDFGETFTPLGSSIQAFFQTIWDLLGNIFMAIFSILFISFFMIRDRELLKNKAINSLSNIIPESSKKINTIIFFIRRYVVGISIQTMILFILFGLGMEILNIPNAWTLAIFASIINIIPYFGPIIGLSFAMIITGTDYLSLNLIYLMMPGMIKLIILFSCIQSIDNFILQPTIFSRAFQAHPLEIFIVAVSAGLIGGVMWMVIAMPLYTMIRIIFSELIINIK